MTSPRRIMTPLATASLVFANVLHAHAAFDLGTARLEIDGQGRAAIAFDGEGEPWPASPEPFVQLTMDGVCLVPERVVIENGTLTAQFPGGASCAFTIECGPGFALFTLTRLEAPADPERLSLFTLPVPRSAEIMNTLNAARTDTRTVALSAAEPNVHAFVQTRARNDADRDGCSHELVQADEAKAGRAAARYTATCNETPAGWSLCGRRFPAPIDLTGLKAVRAWIHGDGNGQQLKIQLLDDAGGYRDSYIPITFEGWQQVTIADPAADTLDAGRVRHLNLYYNGLPAGRQVTCLIDQIEAVVDRDGHEEAVLLEDFESATFPFLQQAAVTLNLETLAAHGIQPARFGIIAAPNADFLDAMQRFEAAAGLPSPHPGGVWNKRSPWIKRSYLFITRFDESQFDDVVAMAKRGGFDMILILQSSWARATGHYEVNADNFGGGLDALAATIQRFKQAGFHVGLHFLGPSIYPPDPYLTPVPDPRLFKDAEARLAADIDEQAGFVPVAEPPEAFPAEDGGYLGAGAVLQIGDELIQYGSRAMEAPFGFAGCTRGILGTAAAPHPAGSPVMHLKKSYGYFLFDMDTSLLDEVSTNFARVANACDIDMIYFDGSERLQGDHWYYNARLHKAFFDKLARKDILIQASSFSHYSWHILARSASADGHGDIKGYLDERSGWLDAFKRNAMPLDIGWYYGYDPGVTPDVFEYVLGATIGYDSSMSFQVSLDAASRHPFVGEILDLIAGYERLRLSGRVPEDMRERLRIDPALAGVKEPEARAALLDLRREYRLIGDDAGEALQRVVYEAWHEVSPAVPESAEWPFEVRQGPAALGVQVHLPAGRWLAPGPSYRGDDAITLESFDDLAPYLPPSGATLDGVSQSISQSEEGAPSGAPEGGRYAVYTAESARADAAGWAVTGKRFDPPLDLAAHKVIGFWLRGDGKGGSFKLQLLDGAKAADFYIQNDYEGWRYQQLVPAEPNPIDYGRVTALNFYYNGLPAKTTVSCAIDDVKALPQADVSRLVEPWVEVDGHRIAWDGTLTAGEYVFLWPGEPWKRYGPDRREPETGTGVTPTYALSQGPHTVRFGSTGAPMTAPRVRLTLQPAERHALP
ncbi:MAG: hypothetical protein JXR94_11345 [Candidatus Hydrogenedentes bacterium]|nr:hypothetical protein [Candidatus Hydrogenedentota bacterium]